MKVLHINAISGFRSTGRICVEIADYLNHNGHEGYIAYSYGLPYWNGYKIGTKFEIKLHGLWSRVFGLQGYFSKNGTSKLIEYIKNLNPDVIHLHNLHGNFINLKMLFNYLAENDVATVLTLHDCWFYTGKCTHYTVDGCYKWQQGCEQCSRLKKDNPSWFFDRTKIMYNDKKEWFKHIPRLAVIGVSEWITKEARKSILSSAKIITRIYNWVDTGVYKPVDGTGLRRKLGVENKFVILGVSSGWNHQKGLDHFIELSRRIPENMRIVLVGIISGANSLPSNIIHLNETHDVHELVEIYSSADLFLNLSLEETFGKVTAEALACGTPAVVIKSTASPEIIGGRCGYIIDKLDYTQLLKVMMKVKERGKQYYSDHCISFVKKTFGKDDRLADYIHVYEKIVGYKV
ncbi:glycosyltransferase [Heliobacterium chlorum]|uniref:Glycosyltransferase n=1 Tax=Heliobacterium chlorum TaxID=2698 RepID=A0ABR7T6H9_HELCL|nr:glycosyltransferase [Heliobacterium chlorum]MBC9785832.1 glycosyltransferase [Heliobacterium chlorum]